MNANSKVRVRTRIFTKTGKIVSHGEYVGYDSGPVEIGAKERHVRVSDIPTHIDSLMRFYGLNGDVEAVKLTITPDPDHRAGVEEPETPEPAESFPVYAPPDTSKFYPEGF